MKWSFVPQDTGKPTYVVVNFDESEPGTCNNRELVEREPHQLLEGADDRGATRSGATRRSSTCRGEFLWPGTVLAARDRRGVRGRATSGTDILGSGLRPRHRAAPRRRRVHLRRGDRAARTRSKGFRGQPRLRPPFPAVEGLYASPTVINNVETLMNVPAHRRARRRLVQRARAPRSRPARRCSRSAGKVERPGNYELPLGTPFRVLLEELGGGMLGGRHAEGVDAGRVVDADAHRRAPRRRAGLRVDRGGGLAARHRRDAWCMDETDCVVEAARRLVEFYAHESCGKCTPCREGTWWATRVLGPDRGRATGAPEDIPLLHDVGGEHAVPGVLRPGRRRGVADQLVAAVLHGRVRGARAAGPVPALEPRTTRSRARRWPPREREELGRRSRSTARR